MSKNVDVAIIGAGTAGLNAFSKVRQKTANVILINDGHYGTTCARVGCMPSKVLIEVAKEFSRRQHFADFGINGNLTIDRTQVMKHVRKMRDWFVGRVMQNVDKIGEKNLKGRARFIEPQVLEVNGEPIHANKIIIATGSRPILPPKWRELGVITTDEFFELETLPNSMAIVGLGAIGSELGQALARLGIRVVGVEMQSTVCGLSDPEVNKVAIEELSKDFDVWMESTAELSKVSDGIKVETTNGHSTTVEMVLASLGRTPNLDNLGLEVLGIKNNNIKDIINPNTMQLADLPIFIAGDVTSLKPILHEVADEGAIAGYNAVSETIEAFKRRVPLRIAFTDPQTVVVGASLSELKEQNQDIIIGERSFKVQGRTKVMARNHGLLRIYAERQSGRLLGSEMMIPDGEYIGHFLAMAIENNLTVRDVMVTPFYHPTVLEGLDNALNMIAAQLEGGNKAPVLRKLKG